MFFFIYFYVRLNHQSTAGFKIKHIILSAFLVLLLQHRSFTQECTQWVTALADARFYDTNLVIFLSPDYDQLIYSVQPPVKPGYIHVTTNMLHGAPVGNIPKHIEMLKDELLNERLYLSNKEFKELFLRRMSVLIFFEFADIRNIDESLIQTVTGLMADKDKKISEFAALVIRLYEFYSERSKLLLKYTHSWQICYCKDA